MSEIAQYILSRSPQDAAYSFSSKSPSKFPTRAAVDKSLAQGEARRGLVALNFDNDFLEQRPHELLPVARRRGCGMPNGSQVSSEREQTTALILGERRWARLFAAGKLGLGGLERAQALLPFALEAASDQAVVGIDGAVAALCAARFEACPLERRDAIA